ncbi:hypothetical protein, partial [Calditerricola satsumensis]|uniref:hypothetical protein n=1 Tax=Calditerricola satsumensis TaxID=373054 RepID=UPI0012EDEE9B
MRVSTWAMEAAMPWRKPSGSWYTCRWNQSSHCWYAAAHCGSCRASSRICANTSGVTRRAATV